LLVSDLVIVYADQTDIWSNWYELFVLSVSILHWNEPAKITHTHSWIVSCSNCW